MNFIRGMDISSMPEMLDKGFVYYDFDGKQKDPLLLAKENGVNAIRLRVWNDPKSVPESGGYCDKDQTVNFARRVKEMGFLLFLDFHYSDWWADPGQQRKPKAWKNLGFSELCQAVYDYTKEVLEALREADAYPEMVQIGNEIRSGMIFPEGAVQNWPLLAELINHGIQAVRDMEQGRHTDVVIHLDQGGRYYYFRDWFDAALAHGVTDFDIIGLSYYPFWHGTFYEFKDTLEYVAKRYGRPLIVAETAHAFRLSDQGFIGKEQEEIAGFPADRTSQREVLELVMSITAHVDNGMGRGVFYWEPMMIPGHGNGGWAENMGVIDENGCCMEGMKAFRPQDYAHPEEIVKLYYEKEILQILGQSSKLPKQINCLRRDGRLEVREVSFTGMNLSQAGSYVCHGKVKGTELVAKIDLQVVDRLPAQENILVNGDFHAGLQGWLWESSDEQVEASIRLDEEVAFPEPPQHFFQFNASLNFQAALLQRVWVEPGNYEASLEYRGDNTTGVMVSLYLNGEQDTACGMIHPSDESWKTYRVPFSCDKAQYLQVELTIKSPPIYGKVRKVQLYRKE